MYFWTRILIGAKTQSHSQSAISTKASATARSPAILTGASTCRAPAMKTKKSIFGQRMYWDIYPPYPFFVRKKDLTLIPYSGMADGIIMSTEKTIFLSTRSSCPRCYWRTAAVCVCPTISSPVNISHWTGRKYRQAETMLSGRRIWSKNITPMPSVTFLSQTVRKKEIPILRCANSKSRTTRNSSARGEIS